MLKVVPVQASSPDLISLLEATGAGLFWHANEEDICCMQMRGPQLRADRFFFFLPCPRHFCCCLTGFPGDLDQHFHNRVSKVSLPHPAIQGQPGEQVRLPGAVQRQPSHGSCLWRGKERVLLVAAKAQPHRAPSSPWARPTRETCLGKSWPEATSLASLTRDLLFSGINTGKLATVHWQ